MTIGVNKVILVGNVGEQPKISADKQGRVILNFSLATNEEWRDKKTGEKNKSTQWHRIVVFEPLSNNISHYITKGRTLYVDGKLRYRSFDDDQGIKRHYNDVIASSIVLLGGRGHEDDTLVDDITPHIDPQAKDNYIASPPPPF